MTSPTTRPWALVTGASDGIGEACCPLLAIRGYDLVLVARREDRLREVAARMTAAHGVATHVVPCDLAAPDAAATLHRRVRDLGVAVDVLVNNAGLLHNGYFDEIAREKHEALLAVNVVALTSLTHLFAADMLARGRGRILNVASAASWMAIPQQNVYAASKAYVLAFTIALNDELRAKGGTVTATALCPSYTRTKMLDNPEQGWKLTFPEPMILDVEEVARDGVEGCLAGRPVVIPGMSNRLTLPLVQCLPRTWVTRVMGALYRRSHAG